MDLASIIGLVMCLVVVIFGILYGQPVSAILNFVDIPSVLITIGGSLLCTLIMSPSLKGFVENISSIRLALSEPRSDDEEAIKTIIQLSNVARKEGLLALEEAANNVDDEFMKKGLLLLVDGTDPELVRNILETELSCIESRHAGKVAFWEAWAAMGPAWGMIGTLIGLINMLKKLDDISSVGPNMAVALITTFYGSLIANWVCIPVAAKLKQNSAKEIGVKELVVEGLLSIQAGENPRVIEEKLKSFLSPARRAVMNDESGERVG
ncbi:MAG: putative rane protein [Herbinix sp.]|nr:putative rane protein [Herbinix sp.]